MLINLILQIKNPELKEEYLKKLKKLMTKDVNKPSKSKISLDENLERFSKQKPKAFTTSYLQYEISKIKQDIVGLKKEVSELTLNNKKLEQELLISKVNNCFQEQNFDDSGSEPSHEEESNNILSSDVKIINLINKVCPPRWYANIHIVVAQDYAFDVIALIDSGADLNCIQEGLIPSNILRNLLLYIYLKEKIILVSLKKDHKRKCSYITEQKTLIKS